MAETPDYAKEENQIARSKLREGFLRKMMELQGSKCTILTHEKTVIKGEFKGFNVDVQELLFDNLETPTGKVPHSIVRANDVISLEFVDKKDET